MSEATQKERLDVVRTAKDVELFVSEFTCNQCSSEFVYGVGFPSYCPDCGEEFLTSGDSE